MYQEDSFKTSQVVYAHTRSDEADMEYKMHCHNSYEIYYMVKGNVEYFLEGTSYVPKPGSLLIIPPNCFHGLRVLDGSEYHRIRLHFVPELLTEKEKQLLTKFIIAQRISSIQDADHILVLEGGQIDAMGTHEQLLASNRIYREVYESQNKAGGADNG